MPIESATLLRAARDMAVIRRFEERMERLFYENKIRGSVHLGIGQEAVAVGASAALRDGDTVVPTYRGHGWVLARGIPAEAAFAEMLGRRTGCNSGRGGSKHLGDAARGVYPSNAIVGAGAALACGAAWAAQLDGTGAVAVTVFGDGATNQGVMHEAMNLAATMRLPVLFVCENNLYSEMTPIRAAVTVESLTERAAGYRMPSARVDGMDVEAVHAAVTAAADSARSGEGPVFLEMLTYRFCGHMPGDREIYRTKEEVARWRERDPLVTVRRTLIDRGVAAEEIDAVYRQAAETVAAAEEAAFAAPLPDVCEIGLGAPEWVQVDWSTLDRPARVPTTQGGSR